MGANSKRWFSFIEKLVPPKTGIILSELFFWSSNKVSDLDKRYGNWKNGPIIEFCAAANVHLLRQHEIKTVIFFGLSMAKLVERLYNLSLIEIARSKMDDKQLAKIYRDPDDRVWIVFSHPNTRGMTKSQREEMRLILEERFS